MTTTDYIVDILLIAVVFRQMRARLLTPASMLLPVVLVGVACADYLRAFTPHGNDIALIAVLTAAGLLLGLLSGVVTSVRRDADGDVVARAGLTAAAFWVAGMGFRFGFAVWSTGDGATGVARFSVDHHISGARAWTTALVLMAVGEVLARVAVLQLRRIRAPRTGPVPHDVPRPVAARSAL